MSKFEWLTTRSFAIVAVFVLDLLFLFLYWLPHTPDVVRPVMRDAFMGANSSLFLALSLKGPANPPPPGA